MIMVADFTGKLRLELQLPRSAAKTGGNSLVSGTSLITQAAHLVAVTSHREKKLSIAELSKHFRSGSCCG
jgi:hypothetical protein